MSERGSNASFEVLTPLYARVDGSARASTVLLLHPLGLDHSIWNDVAERLAPLATTIACDLRGHGRSPRAEAMTVEQMAGDLVALLDELGRERAVVVGLSLGGCVAQALAIVAPERVEGLVLVDTTAWYGPEAVANWEGRIAQLEATGFAGLREFSLHRWFSPEFVAEHPERAQAALAIFCRNDLASYRAACRALGTADLREGLAGVTVPTAILVGSLDEATPIPFAEALHELIAGSSLDVLEGAGHFSAIERGDAVAAAAAVVLAAR